MSAHRPDGWCGKNSPGFAEDLCAWLVDRHVEAVGGGPGSSLRPVALAPRS